MKSMARSTRITAIFDDDPTGIQTVHGCPVVTSWDVETVRSACLHPAKFFFVLTNTRARTVDDARRVVTDAARTVLSVTDELGLEPLLVSRSDSTLRSHFPLEVDVLRECLLEAGRSVGTTFFVPAFFEGGRVTDNDTHYLREGDSLVPTATTEFARDSVFGYTTSHLPSYIAEKTDGRVPADAVASVDRSMLSSSSNGSLATHLRTLTGSPYTVVNACAYDELDRFIGALTQRMDEGHTYLFHGAASLVRSLTRCPEKPLLTDELRDAGRRGLVVVGSHVEKSTRQLNAALSLNATEGIELDVRRLLDRPEAEAVRAADAVRACWKQETVPVAYTSRQELRFPSPAERLAAGRQISSSLVSLVKAVRGDLQWLIGKGGITSHDLLADALGVTTALVQGQILPGVPVVTVTVADTPIPYVIFPGNVGTDLSLAETIEILTGAPQ